MAVHPVWRLWFLAAVFCFAGVPALLAQEEHAAHPGHEMRGLLGPYPMSREASGTSWQPDATPHEGIVGMWGEGMGMLHGFANVIYDDQGGERGNSEFLSTNMLMGMARRSLGPGTFGMRGMFSLEPATVGEEGYPLLLQTGETGDGRTPLIDRQHPHDLFMELAATYSLPVSEESAVFTYLGLPGEPALGPPTFMHRFSGVDNPEAPLAHHWLDSTHITHGVATAGYVWRNLKLEGSAFRGREPDEDRWDIEAPKLDSFSGRVSYNPTENWALQASYGTIDSPEQLEPDVDTGRATASASYHRPWGQDGRHNWQTTFAWGRNRNDPGRTLDAFLLESAVNLGRAHTFFGRAENVEKDELFPESHPKHGKVYNVSKVSLGYIYDFPEWNQVQWGLGGLGSVHLLPDSLEPDYGETPRSFMIFARAKL